MPKHITKNVISKTMRGSNLTFYSQSHHESKFYLGCEIECDGGRSRDSVLVRAKQLLNRNGLFNIDIHGDGSLGPSGFELVTAPATLGAIKQSAPQWVMFFMLLAQNGYNINENASSAGFHIHLAKRSLGKTRDTQKENIMKINKFIGRNADAWSKYTGRLLSNRWACWYPDPFDRCDRYQLVNVWTDKTRGYSYGLKQGKTVEFRGFSYCSNFTQYLAMCELVNRLASVATDASKNMDAMTLGDLLNADKYAVAMRTNPNAYMWYVANCL